MTIDDVPGILVVLLGAVLVQLFFLTWALVDIRNALEILAGLK